MNKMNKFESYSRFLPWFMALLLVASAAGCGGGGDQGRDPILGTGAGAVAVPPASPSVLSTNPVAAAVGVCPSATVNATFSVPSGLRMDPLTVNATTFTVTGPGLTPVAAASVVLDVATGRIATFTPSAALTNGVLYTATIKGGATGVKDLAIPGNTMLADFTWTFTAGPATGACLAPVNLGVASTYGIATTAGLTNTGATTINGDVVVAAPTLTCNAAAVPGGAGTPGFGLCGGAPPTLNGSVVTPSVPDATTATNVKAAMNAAFLDITPPAGPPAAGSRGGATSIAAGTTLGEPTGAALVQGDNLFVPGLYQSITSIMITGDLTLDAQGNSSAVFIFQSSSTVGTAPNARILLVNGARASNVYWQAASSATLGTGTTWQGNIFAAADITMNTGATSCGRLWSGAWVGGSGAFVFNANVVSVPGNPSAPVGCQ